MSPTENDVKVSRTVATVVVTLITMILTAICLGVWNNTNSAHQKDEINKLQYIACINSGGTPVNGAGFATCVRKG